jgi:hypothetical protein
MLFDKFNAKPIPKQARMLASLKVKYVMPQLLKKLNDKSSHSFATSVPAASKKPIT